MMRVVLTTLLIAGIVLALPAKPPPKKKSSAHAVSTHATAKKSAHRSRRGRVAHTRKPPAPSYQLHPDPERYQQIQQALADRGYYKGPVDGSWNNDSVDALKRFQTDQKLTADGKINSLSLTGLGLGPKHDGSSAGTVPLSAAKADASGAPDVPPVSELPAATDPPANATPSPDSQTTPQSQTPQ